MTPALLSVFGALACLFAEIFRRASQEDQRTMPQFHFAKRTRANHTKSNIYSKQSSELEVSVGHTQFFKVGSVLLLTRSTAFPTADSLKRCHANAMLFLMFPSRVHHTKSIHIMYVMAPWIIGYWIGSDIVGRQRRQPSSQQTGNGIEEILSGFCISFFWHSVSLLHARRHINILVLLIAMNAHPLALCIR